MPRTAAKITQADVARTIRAAKQAGASSVEVRPDGTIFVRIDGSNLPPSPISTEVAPEKKQARVF